MGFKKRHGISKIYIWWIMDKLFNFLVYLFLAYVITFTLTAGFKFPIIFF